jgi:hypothetical protein
MATKKKRVKLDVTLQEAFVGLRIGDVFGVCKVGEPFSTLLCVVTERVKGKVMADVINGSWVFGFNTTTLVARPFGVRKQQYAVRFCLADKTRPMVRDMLSIKSGLTGQEAVDMLNWMNANEPVYEPPRVKHRDIPSNLAPGPCNYTFHLDGGQTLKFQYVSNGKTRLGTTAREVVSALTLHASSAHSENPKILDLLNQLRVELSHQGNAQ